MHKSRSAYGHEAGEKRIDVLGPIRQQIEELVHARDHGHDAENQPQQSLHKIYFFEICYHCEPPIVLPIQSFREHFGYRCNLFAVFHSISHMASKELTQETLISDEDIVQRVKHGESYLFEIIMRRYNQRLFRVVRSILNDVNETEEVMQDAYVRAYEHLQQFEGRAKFSTWLTKIAVYEAYARVRNRQRFADFDNYMESLIASSDRSPEQTTFNSEMRALLEGGIDALPDDYRTVLMMRDVEGMTTGDTAEALGITEENVKVRLFRARALLRRKLFKQVGTESANAFQFLGDRCDRVVECVLRRIAQEHQV
jgi:RNA polymerase sigma-70 factor, ECF subfamily